MVEVVIIAACLLISAAFGAAETSLTSYSDLKAKHMLEKHGLKARIMEFWLKQPTRALTAILVGNNLVNILASAIATDVMLRAFPSGRGIVIATALMTVLILLFSEVLPKTMAKAHAERMVMPALYFVKTAYVILWPAVMFFAKFAEAALRLFGSKETFKPAVTEEEIEFLIGVGEKEGSLENEKRMLLENVFEFGKTIAREVMVPRTDMATVSILAPIDQVIDLMLAKGHSRLPVYDGREDNIVGMIHAKDLLRKVKEDRDFKFSIKEIMLEPIFVAETKLVHELLLEMKTKKRQMVIVIDEYGGTAGLLTFEDLIEEIVGEVRDEYDENEEDYVQELAPGRYLVDARLNFTDFINAFEDQIEAGGDEINESEAEEAPYNTVGGFVIDQLGHIPQSGEEFSWGHLSMRVKDVSRRRIKKLEVITELASSKTDASI